MKQVGKGFKDVQINDSSSRVGIASAQTAQHEAPWTRANLMRDPRFEKRRLQTPKRQHRDGYGARPTDCNNTSLVTMHAEGRHHSFLVQMHNQETTGRGLRSFEVEARRGCRQQQPGPRNTPDVWMGISGRRGAWSAHPSGAGQVRSTADWPC